MMDFGDALRALKAGKLVSRAGWNGKGMFLFLVPGSTFKVNRPPLQGIFPEGTEIRYHGHIDMKTADDMVVPWLCSQTDVLAEDWGIVEGLPAAAGTPIPIASMDGAHATAGTPSIVGGATMTPISIGVGGSAPRAPGAV